MLILLQLLGAVALLIWGIHMVQSGLLRAWGGALRQLLAHAARRRRYAFAGGVAVSAAVQSSTATTLMAAGFVSQQLLPLAAALPVVLGADVGASLIAQGLAQPLGWLAPLLILGGVIAFRLDHSQHSQQSGRAAIGLGLMLLALQLMRDTLTPLGHSDALRVVFQSLTGDVLLDILVAALLAVLAHSGLAVVLLVVALVEQGALAPALGLALVVGANLGGCGAPLLTASGASRQLLAANLGCKLLTAALLAPLLTPLQTALAAWPLSDANQVLALHLLFNLLCAALFLPFTRQLARLCARLGRDDSSQHAGQPRYLDPGALAQPELAIACATREALRLGDLVDDMLRGSEAALCDGDERALRAVADNEQAVDSLYRAIKSYLIGIAREELSSEDNQRWFAVLSLTINLEYVGDVIDNSLMVLARRKLRNQLPFSEHGQQEIRALHQRLLGNLRLGLQLMLQPDTRTASRLLQEKNQFDDLERRYADNHLQRLAQQQPQSLASSGLHLDVIRDLKRINSYLCTQAYPILDSAGVLTRSHVRTDAGIEHGRPLQR